MSLSIRSCGLSAATSTLKSGDCAEATRSNSCVGSNGPAGAGSTVAGRSDTAAAAGAATDAESVDVAVAGAGTTAGDVVAATFAGAAGLELNHPYTPPAIASTAKTPMPATRRTRPVSYTHLTLP